MAQTGKINDLDNRLLNPAEESGAAGKLREEKRGRNKNGGEPSSAEAAEAEAGGEPQSLRQRVKQARQALNLKELARKKIKEKALSPLKQLTTKALFNSWWMILVTGGAGIVWSFFYINIHVLGRWVLGEELFCKLGEEWLPNKITQAAGAEAEPVTKGIGIIEVIVLLILDLIVLAVIFGVLALLVMIVDFMQASILEKIKMFIGGLSGLGWGGIKALYNLFAK